MARNSVLVAAVVVAGLGLAGCGSAGAAPASRPASTPVSAASGSTGTADDASGIARPVAGVGAETVRVVRVVDGDTFDIGDGERVRVLGIDSCEAGTPGGTRATDDAGDLLTGRTVTLTREQGVDRDPSDRLLRYVSTRDGDFGRLMVARDHTAVFDGRNDAAESYLSDLRERDRDGRDCGDSGSGGSFGPGYTYGGHDRSHDGWSGDEWSHDKWSDDRYDHDGSYEHPRPTHPSTPPTTPPTTPTDPTTGPSLPNLPGLPSLPSVPGLPSIPGLPSLPSIPGLPGTGTGTGTGSGGSTGTGTTGTGSGSTGSSSSGGTTTS